MLKCPKCGSTRFFRTQLRWWERPSRLVNGGRPYRCQDCLWREWLPWQAAAAGVGGRRSAAHHDSGSPAATDPVAANPLAAGQAPAEHKPPETEWLKRP